MQCVDTLHQPLGIRPQLETRAVAPAAGAVQAHGRSLLHHKRETAKAPTPLARAGVAGRGAGVRGAGGGGGCGRCDCEVVEEGGSEWLVPRSVGGGGEEGQDLDLRGRREGGGYALVRVGAGVDGVGGLGLLPDSRRTILRQHQAGAVAGRRSLGPDAVGVVRALDDARHRPRVPALCRVHRPQLGHPPPACVVVGATRHVQPELRVLEQQRGALRVLRRIAPRHPVPHHQVQRRLAVSVHVGQRRRARFGAAKQRRVGGAEGADKGINARTRRGEQQRPACSVARFEQRGAQGGRACCALQHRTHSPSQQSDERLGFGLGARGGYRWGARPVPPSGGVGYGGVAAGR
eukprot:scaffold12987_cov83-Isochrysis_galbana.AAC.2